MTTRERREARAARLREWADKREAKAQAGFQAVHDLADSIPMGQPILVGHHSEAHARRDQDLVPAEGDGCRQRARSAAEVKNGRPLAPASVRRCLPIISTTSCSCR